MDPVHFHNDDNQYLNTDLLMNVGPFDHSVSLFPVLLYKIGIKTPGKNFSLHLKL